MLKFSPERLSVGVSLSTERIRKLRSYHHSNISNMMHQPYSLLFVKEYLGQHHLEPFRIMFSLFIYHYSYFDIFAYEKGANMYPK